MKALFNNKETFTEAVLNHGSKYFGAMAIVVGVNLVMTKYYTSVFNPSEFGLLSLYSIAIQYITILITLNIDNGFTRLYFDYKGAARSEYISTIFWFFIFTSITIFITALILLPFIVPLVSIQTEGLYVASLIAGIFLVFVNFLMKILYNEQLSKSVFKHTIIQLFFNHFASFSLISLFNIGVIGRQIGQAIGYITNVFSLTKDFYKKKLFELKIVFNKSMLKETWHLSFPGLITVLISTSYIYLDRIFLKHFYGIKEVGVYSIGFILGQGLSIIYEAISASILPKVMTNLKGDYKKNITKFEKFSYQYYIGLISIAFISIISSKWLVMLISTKDYMDSARVVPFLIAGFMMGGFQKIPSLILSYYKVVWFLPFLSFFSFGMGGIFNYLFISRYSIIGAGFATFLGLFLYSFVLQLISMKYNSKIYNRIIMSLYISVIIIMTLSFYNAI